MADLFMLLQMLFGTFPYITVLQSAQNIESDQGMMYTVPEFEKETLGPVQTPGKWYYLSCT